MNTYELNAPVYRYFTTNLLTNEILAEIPFQGVSYERALSAAGSFSGSIPMFADTDHLELYNNTMPGQVGLYVLRDDVCVWGGIIWSRGYDIISKSLSISASEFPSYLQHRVVWGNFFYTKAAETAAPSGSNLIVTLPSTDTFTCPVGSSVYLNFTQEALWDLTDFYTVLSSPAPTSTTFAVSMASFPNNKTVSNRSSSAGTATITTSTAHEFENGMFVTISGVTIGGAQTNPFNGTFSVVDAPSSTTFTFSIKKSVTKRSVTAGVATLTTAEDHGLAVNDSITISDVGTGYDGTRTITAVTDRTVSFNVTAITNENEVTIAGEIYRANIAAGSPYTGGGTAKIRITIGETIAESDLQVTFRTDTYDYVRNFLREIFTDFVAVAGSNVELGVIPSSGTLGKLQHSAEITNKALTNNVATITTATRTKLFSGQRITVSNVDSTFNGTYTISTVNRSSNTISYVKSNANVASTAVTSSPISVTKRALSNGVVTLRTASNHGLAVGNRIKVTNVDPKWLKASVYNSPAHNDEGETMSEYFVVTAVPTANTISYKVATKVQKKTDIEAEKWYLSEPDSTYSVSRKKLSSNVATITTTEKHNLDIGDTVRISGVAASFNGTHTVTAVPTDKSFRFAKVAKDVIQQNSPGRVVVTERSVSSGAIDYSARAIAYTYGPFPDKADIGITIQSGFSGINAKPEDLNAADLVTAKEHLDRYIARTEGFDYRIDCTYNPATGEFEREFVFVPVDLPNPPAFDQASSINRFGADEIVFEYPGNIASLTVDESSEDASTRFFVMSSDSKATGGLTFVGASDGRLLSDNWPLLDMKEKQDWPVYDQNVNRDKYTNIDPVMDLTKSARRYLKESRPPTGSISVTVNGSITPYVGTYDPGDWCSIVANDEFILQRLASDLELRNTALVRKIISYSVEVPDNPGAPETVTLNLLPEWEVDDYGQ